MVMLNFIQLETRSSPLECFEGGATKPEHNLHFKMMSTARMNANAIIYELKVFRNWVKNELFQLSKTTSGHHHKIINLRAYHKHEEGK
jgi:hypothetical protein